MTIPRLRGSATSSTTLRRGWSGCNALRVYPDGAVTVRGPDGEWVGAETGSLGSVRTVSSSADGREHEARYIMAGPGGDALELRLRFSVEEAAVLWEVFLENKTNHLLEVGDLAEFESAGVR